MLLALAVLALSAGGVAWAVIPDTGTRQIHGCYSTTSGALRVIDPSKGQSCASGEAALNWNAAGLNFRGGWNATNAYGANDVVVFSGSTYVAKSANTNSRPPSSNWALLAGNPYSNVFSESNVTNDPPYPIILSSNLESVGSTTSMPAGNYTVNAQVQLFVDNDAQDVNCDLEDNHGNTANGYAETSGPPSTVDPGSVQTMSISDAFPDEPAGTRIKMECAMGNGADPNSSEAVSVSIVATQAGTLVYNGTSNPQP